MKNILLILTLFATLIATAQTASVPRTARTPTPFCITAQLVNISNSYPGTALDTLTNATTMKLTLCSGVSGAYVPFALINSGDATFNVVGTKISGAAYGGIYLESSANDSTWANEAYNTIYKDSALIDTAQTTITKSWHIKRVMPYYRLRFNQIGTGVWSYSGFMYFVKTQEIDLPVTTK